MQRTFGLEIMEAFGRKNKAVLTVLTDLVAVLTGLTVLTALFLQIWGRFRGGSKNLKTAVSRVLMGFAAL